MFLCDALDANTQHGTLHCSAWVEYVPPPAGLWDELTFQDVGLLASAALMLYAVAWVVRQTLHFIKTL